MEYCLRVLVLTRSHHVLVQPVEADELSDHVLQEALEPVRRVSKPLDSLVDVELAVNVCQLAVELCVCKFIGD